MGIELLVMMVISIGLSLLASYLLAPKTPRSPVDVDKPTILTTRGSFIPWIKGRRRTGYVFCWADDRYWYRSNTKHGKVPYFWESGMHALCVGPAEKLHRIHQGGDILFEGPITRTSHPSGTTINLGFGETFRIYWGEATQPVDTYMAGRMGVNSRWPNICYILWYRKYLGNATQWPVLEYDIETTVQNTVLSDTSAYMTGTPTLSSHTIDIEEVQDGISGVGYIKYLGDQTPYLKIGNDIRIYDNAMGEQDLTIDDIETAMVLFYTGGWFKTYIPTTTIYVTTTISGSDDNGYTKHYETSAETGLNAAHVIAEMLFADWPNGLKLDQSEWDIQSLEDLGTLVGPVNEDIPTSWIAKDGRSVKKMLGAGHQDLGVLLPIDPESGLLKFVPIREPTGSLRQITERMLVNPLPQIETIHAEKPVDKLIFSFMDQENSFREMTIAIDDDSQAYYLEHQRARKVGIFICTVFSAASKIAERRSQEEMSSAVVYKINANHGARTIQPGEAFLLEGFPEVLRCATLDIPNPLSGNVLIEAANDFYGTHVSSFVNDPGGEDPVLPPTTQDPAFWLLEVPEHLLEGGSTPTGRILRIRGHSQIQGTVIWYSANDSDYFIVEDIGEYHTGGTLEEALSATGPSYMETGPTFEVVGEDIDQVLDLSGDTASWRTGRQLLVINGEVCFAREITLTTTTEPYIARVDGLLRARWDTQKTAHPIGSYLFILDSTNVTDIQDVLHRAQIDLYVKSQAYSGQGYLDLGASPKIWLDPAEGKGIVPMRNPNFWITAPRLCVNVYRATENISFQWTYMSALNPGSDAGSQAAGQIHSAPEIDGTFKLEFYTSGDVLQGEVEITDATTYTYTNAQLQADFGSEPSSFKAVLKTMRGGYISESKTLTITKGT